MKKSIRIFRLIICSLLLCSLPGWERCLLAQDEKANLDKILDPLPPFEPFEGVPSHPRFFPDEVDRRVRRALIDSLTDNHQTLKDHVRFFKERDDNLARERETTTGLTDHVVDLHHGMLRDRRDYLKAQEKALASATSDRQKKLIQSRIRNDELNQAEELLRKSMTNRWGAVINRLLRSVDIVSILSGSYLGAAVDAALSQILKVGSTSMSVAERKALVLYMRYLKRYPDDPRREELRKVIDALTAKKKKVLVTRHLNKGDEALGNEEQVKAELSYEMAAFIDPESEPAKEKLKKIREEEIKEKNPEEPESSEEGSPETEAPEVVALLHALSLRDPKQIEAQAALVEENHPASPLGESSREALSVALEIRGRHDEAKEVLEKIARSSTSPREVKRAKALLESPEYNHLGSLRKAQSRHRSETIKYVLLGEDLLEKNLLLGAGPILTQGLAGAQTYGISNLLIIGTNLFEVLTKNPISYQSVIDKGVAQVRNHPDSSSSGNVYALLGDAYEKIGRYDKAIAYHQMSGKASQEEIADLKTKAADVLLRAADGSGDRSTREGYLKTILRFYPESDAAKKATGKLARLAKLENRGLKISKKFFMDHPKLYGPEGLGLKASLFDGDSTNLELADQGLNLLKENTALLHFKTPWGVQSRIYPVGSERVERFEVTLRKKHYEIALGDIHSRGQGSTGGLKDLPSQLLHGRKNRDRSHAEVTDFALVKKAVGPSRDYAKVLDHELLSENEKNPGSRFKLPPIKGSISASRFDISGKLPTALWGDQISLGNDAKSPFAGLRLPIPLLQDFIPVDFLLQGRPGRPSLTPQVHRFRESEIEDAHLYR